MATQANNPSPNPQNPSGAQRPELGYAYKTILKPREAKDLSGTQSLFNNYAVFRFAGASDDTQMLYDIAGSQGITTPQSRNPSAGQIIQASHDPSGVFGAAPYSWADFLYAKYYTKIPNNYMVTLRRYGVPVFDNLKTSNPGEPMIPLAQAVTWLGDDPGNKLSELLKFSVGLSWKEIEASVQEVLGVERGNESSPFQNTEGPAGFVNNAAAGVDAYRNPNRYSGLEQRQQDYAAAAYGADGPYANRVYGPVNVINKSMARDRGVTFEHNMSLNFHYKLSSYGDINPKIAMLDIIGNLLSLSYNNAKFWGGAIRYFPQHPNVRFLGDLKKYYNGDMGGYLDSFTKDLQGQGGFVMNQLQALLSDPMGTLKKLASGGMNMWLGGKAAQSRPEILAMRSLMTGAPVGEWHLVVGNPLNPIAMIGNLIVDNITFEFGDELGADDFPTELKATISLKHGRPRDKGDLESMFNYGNGRLYYGELFDPNQQEKLRSSANESNTNRAMPKNSKGDPDNRKPTQIKSSTGRGANGGGMWAPQFSSQGGQQMFFD